MQLRLATATVVCALALSACGGGSDAEPTPSASTVPPTSAPPSPTGAPSPSATPALPPATRTPGVLTEGLSIPWGLAFLPDGSALVTERETARILRVAATGGPATEVQKIADCVPAGEGGLLGIAVSPTYAQDQTVFVYYTTATDNRIAKLVLGQAPVPILTGIPKGTIHNGGRIEFGPDGFLYAGTGETGRTGLAQDPASLGGKILRMTTDGKPAAGAASVVFSAGHRNVQGLAWDTAGRLWATEFGQNTFDEINQVDEGDNDGWPTVEGKGGGSRFVDPLVTWMPSEASPSGAAIVGNVLYVAALRGQRLWQVPLDGQGGVGRPVAALTDQWGRLRAVAKAPDGALWVLTNGRPAPQGDVILRLAAGSPAET
jgi:glucose/arabinose dehydrogenase